MRQTGQRLCRLYFRFRDAAGKHACRGPWRGPAKMNTQAEVLAFGETERDFSEVDKVRVVEALSRVLP